MRYGYQPIGRLDTSKPPQGRSVAKSPELNKNELTINIILSDKDKKQLRDSEKASR